MKKIKGRIILSLLVCIVLLTSSVLVATAATDYGKKGKIKIHFLTDEWNSPYIYYWNSLPTNIEVDWPGDKMSKEKDGKNFGTWYVYEFKGEYSKINFLINNGGEQGQEQTEDFTKTAGEWWYKNGKWYSKDPELTTTGDALGGDMRDDSIYFVMTTRFFDGNEDNNVHCWDDAQAKNPDSDPAWKGDFQGLIDKLDYIKALGFSAIWITPVVKNCSGYDYHGYHAINYSEVDPRYESPGATYQDLINACHEEGIKIIQDVVFNHTGNFGEENLYQMFEMEYNLGNGVENNSNEAVFTNKVGALPSNYDSLIPGKQYDARIQAMKNMAGDPEYIYHNYGNFNWDDWDSQQAQIAGDCVDLNTENKLVSDYTVDAYSKYIEMGVDGFRVDTTKHISRLTFNKAYLPQLYAAADAANNNDFYMFGEVCARDRNIWYRETRMGLSTPFFTWKENKNYPWSDTDSDANIQTTLDQYNDNMSVSTQPTSTNALLNGNEYHTPDYSQFSGMGVIDFPMHWNFESASGAFGVAVGGDKYYNDATWNVTYVDSHDYAPDQAPENQRFAGSQDTWAENLNLMFTFRGIPCIYYGSEIEFQKFKPIDVGPNAALSETGRAYFGDYIKGDVTVTDFAEYTNATGTMAETLNHPLSLHIQRLNKIRREVAALRKGQYSVEGVSGNMAFKRRYTGDDNGTSVDSFVCVAVTNAATFTGIPNGTYVDAITGNTKTVSNGTLSIEGTGKGNMRVYVLQNSTTKTGKIGTDGKYLK